MTDKAVIEKVSKQELVNALSLLDKYVPLIYPSSYKTWREKVVHDYNCGAKTIIGATIEDRLVGIAIYQKMKSDLADGSIIEIKTLLVDERCRQQPGRIGSCLLTHVHYDIQRMGYAHAVIEAKSDQLIVPWLINKGYAVVGTHMDNGWPSYRMEIRLPTVFTDDVHDEHLVLKWIASRIGIMHLVKVSDHRASATYDGHIPLPAARVDAKVRCRISFCDDKSILSSYLKADEDQRKVLFYAINKKRSEIPHALYDRANSANGTILDRDDLRMILGVSLPVRCELLGGGRCLAVLIFPGVFDELVDGFSGREFMYVVSGLLGRLLSRDSRLLFVSNDDFKVLGAASYLAHEHLHSSEEVWKQCSEKIVFDELTFRRWSALKSNFTIFRCEGLKRAPPDFPSRIDTDRVRQNKWDYYSYEAFMRYIKPVLE